jgi:hypothetical protein
VQYGEPHILNMLACVICEDNGRSSNQRQLFGKSRFDAHGINAISPKGTDNRETVKGTEQELPRITFVCIWNASLRRAGSGVEIGPRTREMRGDHCTG